MSRVFAFALAAATVATSAVPAIAQTSADTTRLQTAQDRVNRELSIYRTQSSRGGYNRNGNVRGSAAGQRLDQELSNLRLEIDRYQSLVRNSNGYAQNGSGYSNSNGYSGNNGYSTNNGYNNGQYTNNANDDSNYDASRYYRDGNYQERELSQNDRVYKGTDGRYYCKRSDGTTGLIVGALGGGVLGTVIGGGSSAVGTILGALGGAIAGRAVDRNGGIGNMNSVRCR